MVAKPRPYLVFYGTQTAVVTATSESSAFAKFLRTVSPASDTDASGRSFGRFVPPAREEVTIRRPRESDRGWIEETQDKRFLALLKELVDA